MILQNQETKEIAVIGSGTMGNRIAHSFAFSGIMVIKIDVSEDSSRNAIVTISKKLNLQKY
jgi:3-hydroxybutyryl-CoA dehydrogenase